MKGFTLTIIAVFSFLTASSYSKKEFYNVFEKGTLEELNAFLEKDIPNAHKGALTMKKASFVKSPATKLSLFKEGNKLLEDAIKKEPNNVEYRFLRYVIQVNSPAILGYNKEKETDLAFIKKSKSKLNSTLKKIIEDYLTENNL